MLTNLKTSICVHNEWKYRTKCCTYDWATILCMCQQRQFSSRSMYICVNYEVERQISLLHPGQLFLFKEKKKSCSGSMSCSSPAHSYGCVVNSPSAIYGCIDCLPEYTKFKLFLEWRQFEWLAPLETSLNVHKHIMEVHSYIHMTERLYIHMTEGLYYNMYTNLSYRHFHLLIT